MTPAAAVLKAWTQHTRPGVHRSVCHWSQPSLTCFCCCDPGHMASLIWTLSCALPSSSCLPWCLTEAWLQLSAALERVPGRG